jgi:multidrug efflux pump subunit AcrA (membrane-fusion protein)
MKHLIWCCTFLLFLSCTQKEDGIKPQRKKLIEAVYSSVTIKPNHLYQVNSSISAILEKKMVQDGDIVKKGDVLFQLENNSPDFTKQNAKLQYELAKNTFEGNANLLSELKNEIRIARLKALNDSINYKRQQKLWSQNIGSKVELENRQLAYEASLNNLKTLTNKYNRLKIELDNQLKQAENNLKNTEVVFDNYVIKSKIDGKIYETYKEEGEFVSVQQPLALLGSEKDFIIEMLVDEVDIRKVTLGQRVVVLLEAYENTPFEATVSKIKPKMNERTQTFTVEAIFKNPPANLYMGLTGEANIIIDEKQNALVIPQEYITEDNKIRTKEGTITVKTGLRNLAFVEILSDLDTNTVIYKPQE